MIFPVSFVDLLSTIYPLNSIQMAIIKPLIASGMWVICIHINPLVCYLPVSDYELSVIVCLFLPCENRFLPFFTTLLLTIKNTQ